nr:MAG TPA: hypothetical protein [Caudoviricetes sp.]
MESLILLNTCCIIDCVSLSNMKLKSVESPTSNGGRLIFVH